MGFWGDLRGPAPRKGSMTATEADMRLLLAALFVMLSVGLAPAQDRIDPHADGIRAVISAQIDALRADDFDTAFTFASPTIQRIFGNPERFGAMVQQGYPMVYRPQSLRFLDVAERGGALVQRVLMTDAQGRAHLLEYEMVAGSGGFLINGVRLIQGQVGA
jgi:hypothetical protein